MSQAKFLAAFIESELEGNGFPNLSRHTLAQKAAEITGRPQSPDCLDQALEQLKEMIEENR